MSNTDQNLHVCAFCQVTGRKGAQFVLVVGRDESRVHKHCGGLLMAEAPEGATVRLVHFAELRREKRSAREQREQASVRSFWEEKFSAAQARKGPAPIPLAAE
jgi:hypothetical protein